LILEGDEMNCKACRQKISLYLDNQLNEEEKMAFEEHIKECDECSEELNAIRGIVGKLNEIEYEELPEGYCETLHQKLKVAGQKRKKTVKKWRSLSLVAAALIIVLMVPLAVDRMSMGLFEDITQSSSDMNEMAMEGDFSAPEARPESPPTSTDPSFGIAGTDGMKIMDEESYGSEERALQESKIIKTGHISIETEAYDETMDSIIMRTSEIGGFVEVSETYTNQYSYFDHQANKRVNLKSGYLKILVPQERFYEMFEEVSQSGDVLNKRSGESDMTKYYYDTESRVDNLLIQEERLRQLFERAENITEIMQIENELARVRSQIDAMTLELQDIDYRSNMATITIELREVQGKDTIRPVDSNLWQRAREGFTQSINQLILIVENVIVFIFAAVPIIILGTIILIIIAMTIKRIKKRKRD